LAEKSKEVELVSLTLGVVTAMVNWTKDNIPNLDGKVFVVTGANSGIGYESSLALAEKGATVVMACRNAEKAQQAMEKIKTAVPSAKVETMQLDLASLKSVRSVDNDHIDPLLGASVYATEEAIINSMIAAEDMTGHKGFSVKRLPHNRLQGIVKQYNRS